MSKQYDMNEILKATFGEASSMVRASFKKTVNVKQYETEVIEVSSNLNFERPMSGIERAICSAILQAQLEYETYIQLYVKGYVTETQFNERKSALTNDVNMLLAKGEQLTGKPMDYLIEMVNDVKS